MNRNTINKRSFGFTMIELAIVIIVIGLLVGGIVVGQNMIRGAQLQKISSELNKYRDATNAFKEKYQALPGDMYNATAQWGAAYTNSNLAMELTNCPASLSSANSLTCNGDGNGKIDYPINDLEYGLFWQHLSLAKMIDGKLSGRISGGGGRGCSPYPVLSNSDIPEAPVGGVGIGVSYLGDVSPATYPVAGKYGHVFTVGQPVYCLGNTPYGGFLSPEEALAMDQKLDDSRPGSGNIFTFTSASTPNCTTTDDPLTAVYNTAQTGNNCSLRFKAGF